MQRKPNQADQHPTEPVEADEATIAAAFEQQLAQASTTPALAGELRHAPPTLYRRFVSAYRDLLALSRARRRKLLRSLGMSLAAAALAFALALGGVPTANAAGIAVGGACTLVDAITAANSDTAVGGCAAGSGADTITLSGNVTLTSVNNTTSGGNGLPLITSAITIAGNGFSISRDGSAPAFRILRVQASGNLTLNDTSVTNGLSGNRSGAGILNYGTLTLNNSTINGNNSGSSSGGGIFSQGTITLNNSTVSGNTSGSDGGGGISSGGGGTLTLINSTISGNTSSGSGGILNNGTLILTNSTISGNSAREGGGIFNSGGTVTLTNSTVSGNTASNGKGGGIYNQGGTLTLTNSTISDNTSSSSGGGIYNRSALTLVRSLVSGNTASGVQEIFSTLQVCDPDPYYGCFGGTVVSANYNLFGHSGESNAQAVSGFTPSGSDISATSDGTDPTALTGILSALANNGGPTLTHALVTGSPAIDTAPSGPAADQRGVARPQGAAFDSGAFELVQTPPTPTPTNTPTSTPTNTPTPTSTPTPTQVPNIAPVATNDSYSTNEDTALNVAAPGVLGNDSDADSNPLTAVLVSGPAHGTLMLNANGSFSYTPAANFSGSDSFSYKANDGTANSNVATVSLTVRSALDQIDDLIAAVQALAGSGTINGGQSNALIVKLENAAGYVDNGQTAQAISKLRTFISQVNSFIGSGVLTSAEGQPLIDKANAIIHSLGG